MTQKVESIRMDIRHSFSLSADTYNNANIIQAKVIRHLIRLLNDHPKCLLDIGCGRGGVYENLPYRPEHFVGIDFAEGMLALHPKGEHITLLQHDFNDPKTFEALSRFHFDRIISASALQWAHDLDATLAHIASLQTPVTLAIFTSGTFRTLHQTASLPPILRDEETTRDLLNKHFSGHIETLHFDLKFASVRHMFRYMKHSGVGVGRNVLSLTQMRALMRDYPIDHLEYEIVIMHQKG